MNLYGICEECGFENFLEDEGEDFVYMCGACGCTMEYDKLAGEHNDSMPYF